MFCEKCGAQLKEGDKFCGVCGAEVQDFQEPSAAAGQEKHGKKVRWIIIGAAVIGLAAVAALGFALKQGKEKRDYENYLADGDKYLEELDYEKAEDAYLSAISIDPKQEEPYLGLADLYIYQGRYEEARNILDQGKNEIGEQGNTDRIDQKSEESKHYVDYVWMVEPQIEAEDIYYVSLTTAGTYNDTYQQWMNPWAVIQQNGKKGIIDMDGNLKAPVEYDSVMGFYGTYRLWQGQQEAYDLDSSGALVPGLGFGFDTYTYYYMDGELHCGYDTIENEIPGQAESLDHPVPVQENTDHREKLYELEGLWAVYNGEKLITDFEYDRCGSWTGRLMAVCKDGKWGYIDAEGNVVIPLEYDASWIWKGNWNFEDPAGSEFCYGASGGYVTLLKEGRWSLCDVEGNTVIKEGMFEEIRPVYENRCWVKKDGLWGVIELEGTVPQEEEEEETVSESVFQAMPRGFDFSSGAGGWGTHMDIEDDGTFTGQFHDSDMGMTGDGYPNGTVYICNFSGKFTEPQQVDEYSYSMKLESLELEHDPGYEYYEDGTRYICSEPYGLDNADEFIIYAPGAPVAELPEAFVGWMSWIVDPNTTQTLPRYGIYNVNGQQGFVGEY